MRIVAAGLCALGLGAIAFCGDEARAQETAASSETAVERVGEDGRRIFAPAYFAAFRPQTALDMVRRVPGFSIDEGADVRGFGGAAGNVLIDGARPASKDAELEDLLSQIPATAVDRIELLDGAQAGAQAAGQALVVNVVRSAAEGSQGGGTVTAYSQFRFNGIVAPRVEANLSRRIGGFNVGLSAEHGFFEHNLLVGREGFRTPAGGLLEDGPNRDWRTGVNTGVSVTATGDVAGTRVSLNGSLGGSDFERTWQHAATRAGESAPFRIDTGGERSDETAWETGLSLERGLGEWTGRFNLLAKSEDDTDTSVAGFNLAGQPLRFDRFVSTSTYGERLARATLGRTFGAHAVEAGGEVALNRLETDNRLFRGDGTAFIEVPQGISATAVEEERIEAFITDSWTVTDRLTLDATLTGEWSTISQSGDAAKERSFFYAKPRLTASWRPAEGWALRGRIERVLGQLDFGAFADSASVGDGTANAGNPELRPDQTWVSELTLERRWGERGVIEFTMMDNRIEDAMTIIPLDRDRNGSIDGTALGNIDSARRWGFDLNATVPLSGLAAGLEFRIEWAWRDSELTDPITLRPRVLSGGDGRSLELGLEQTLEDLDLRWGIWSWQGDVRREFNLSQEFEWGENRFWGAWVESTAFEGWTIELGVENPEGRTFTRDRTDFSPNRRGGTVSRTQFRNRTISGEAFLRITRTL